ncbi:hypothetical protein HMPREF1554_01338 [Porphyromonas gingivalis F0569]|nr:hypothetical protein A343_1000 [Porphyromonas gingivalis JCVI SC001]ERJ66405.1 hypothetical protein HMPREF1554_01338 [Porphyromonas gingivalis F0569]OWR76473.1 hypothetical protein SJDPG11_02235 [Porphyromonas gingivalis SJD11]
MDFFLFVIESFYEWSPSGLIGRTAGGRPAYCLAAISRVDEKTAKRAICVSLSI